METLGKLENEYSLRDELDSAWAVRPLALSERLEHMTLVLEDPAVRLSINSFQGRWR